MNSSPWRFGTLRMPPLPSLLPRLVFGTQSRFVCRLMIMLPLSAVWSGGSSFAADLDSDSVTRLAPGRYSLSSKRLVPRRDFDFGRGGAWGALQVGARFSCTDLDDGGVHVGKLGLMMGELNWYLHSHVRWMFNAGGGHVSGGIHDGNLLIFQTRVGVDF